MRLEGHPVIGPDADFDHPIGPRCQHLPVDVFHGDTHVYSDFVSLYRVQGQWRLVSKVFHAHLPAKP